MIKWFSLITGTAVVIFLFRIWQIGGIDPHARDPGNQMLKSWQSFLNLKIEELMPAPQSALLSGMLLGVQTQVPPDLKSKLQATSTIHLIVVSGKNLSLVSAFVLNITRKLGRKPAIYLNLAVILLYSFLTGLGVPVIRAGVMSGLTFLGQLTGRERTGWWILSVSAGILLIWNPNWLLNISFLLSFLATAGVVLVAPIMLEKLDFVPEILKEDLAVSLSAQLLTLPIIAYIFGQISLIGVIVNVLVLWIVSPVMIIGGIGLAVSFISPLVGSLISLIPYYLLSYFLYVVEYASNIPLASLSIQQTSLWIWAGYYCLVCATLILWSKTNSQLT